MSFNPPPHPYDRLNKFKPVCEAHDGGIVDLSVGSPSDPPPPAVVAASTDAAISAATRLHRPAVSAGRESDASDPSDDVLVSM